MGVYCMYVFRAVFGLVRKTMYVGFDRELSVL